MMIARLLVAALLLLAPELALARSFTVGLSAATSTQVLDDQGNRSWVRVTNVGTTNPATCTRITPATATNGTVLAANANATTSVVVYGPETTPGVPLYCFSTSGTTLYIETIGDHGPTPVPTASPTPSP